MYSDELFPTAVRHHREGRLAEAEALYRRVLTADPKHAHALHLLGIIAGQCGRPDSAIDLIGKAIAIDGRESSFHLNLGMILQAQDRTDEAMRCYRTAIALNPGHAEAYNNLGNLLQVDGKSDEAMDCYRNAIRIQPRIAAPYNNMGNLLRDIGRLEESCKYFQRALLLQPNYPEALTNLGDTLKERGRLDEAAASYRRALAFDPNYADAHFGESLLNIARGDLLAGWQKFEWRWKKAGRSMRKFDRPQWNGEDLSGRTILLHIEEGFGDAIQFIRFAPLVKEKGAKVIVECQPELVGLLKTAPGIDILVARNQLLPAFDFYAELLSLPGLLGITLETLPSNIPYLSAEPGQRQTLPDPKANGSQMAVGLVWRGNPKQKNNHRRSVSPETLSEICAVPGVNWVSIQHDASAEEISSLSRHAPVANLGPVWTGWTATASLVSSLDLVLTVDTSIAHLAGALGKPVWLMLSFAPDWRWMVGRSDSPWYPTMRLFRQSAPGDWPGVIANMAEELRITVEGLIGSRTSA